MNQEVMTKMDVLELGKKNIYSKEGESRGHDKMDVLELGKKNIYSKEGESRGNDKDGCFRAWKEKHLQ